MNDETKPISVGDVMKREFHVIDGKATIYEALKKGAGQGSAL